VRFSIHANQITDRVGGPVEQQALTGIPSLFESGVGRATLSLHEREQIEAPLFQQIGQLKVENDYLIKN
jgi:transposase